jgi:hypothetical protein
MDGVLLAYYTGPECSDKQAVNVEFWRGEHLIDHIKFPQKTGNSILIPTSHTKATLIFSYFEDTDGLTTPKVAVDRWQYCSNWKTRISMHNHITATPFERLETKLPVGSLVRCAPLHLEKTWYLPMYREYNVCGEIMTSTNTYNWKTIGQLGAQQELNGRFGAGVLIQPTLWFNGKIICSLSRDVSRRRRAWYSESDNYGVTWSEPVSTNITNDNNSLVAINDNSATPLLIWNFGAGRKTLVIGRYTDHDATVIVKLNNGIASYPNYCFDGAGCLHVVHTDNWAIAHHIFEANELDKC